MLPLGLSRTIQGLMRVHATVLLCLILGAFVLQDTASLSLRKGDLGEKTVKKIPQQPSPDVEPSPDVDKAKITRAFADLIDAITKRDVSTKDSDALKAATEKYHAAKDAIPSKVDKGTCVIEECQYLTAVVGTEHPPLINKMKQLYTGLIVSECFKLLHSQMAPLLSMIQDDNFGKIYTPHVKKSLLSTEKYDGGSLVGEAVRMAQKRGFSMNVGEFAAEAYSEAAFNFEQSTAAKIFEVSGVKEFWKQLWDRLFALYVKLKSTEILKATEDTVWKDLLTGLKTSTYVGVPVATLEAYKAAIKDGNMRERWTLTFRLWAMTVQKIEAEWKKDPSLQKIAELVNVDFINEIQSDKDPAMEYFLTKPKHSWVYLSKGVTTQDVPVNPRHAAKSTDPWFNAKYSLLDQSPPLSDRELRHIFAAEEMGDEDFQRYKKFLYQANPDIPLQNWKTGAQEQALSDNFRPSKSHIFGPFNKPGFKHQCVLLGLPCITGPSGSTDFLQRAIETVKMVDFDGDEAKKNDAYMKLAFNMMGWFLDHRDHTFHEVMVQTEAAGVPYSMAGGKPRSKTGTWHMVYEDWLPAEILEKDGCWPSYYLGKEFMKAVHDFEQGATTSVPDKCGYLDQKREVSYAVPSYGYYNKPMTPDFEKAAVENSVNFFYTATQPKSLVGQFQGEALSGDEDVISEVFGMFPELALDMCELFPHNERQSETGGSCVAMLPKKFGTIGLLKQALTKGPERPRKSFIAAMTIAAFRTTSRQGNSIISTVELIDNPDLQTLRTHVAKGGTAATLDRQMMEHKGNYLMTEAAIFAEQLKLMFETNMFNSYTLGPIIRAEKPSLIERSGNTLKKRVMASFTRSLFSGISWGKDAYLVVMGNTRGRASEGFSAAKAKEAEVYVPPQEYNIVYECEISDEIRQTKISGVKQADSLLSVMWDNGESSKLAAALEKTVKFVKKGTNEPCKPDLGSYPGGDDVVQNIQAAFLANFKKDDARKYHIYFLTEKSALPYKPTFKNSANFEDKATPKLKEALKKSGFLEMVSAICEGGLCSGVDDPAKISDELEALKEDVSSIKSDVSFIKRLLLKQQQDTLNEKYGGMVSALVKANSKSVGNAVANASKALVANYRRIGKILKKKKDGENSGDGTQDGGSSSGDDDEESSRPDESGEEVKAPVGGDSLKPKESNLDKVPNSVESKPVTPAKLAEATSDGSGSGDDNPSSMGSSSEGSEESVNDTDGGGFGADVKKSHASTPPPRNALPARTSGGSGGSGDGTSDRHAKPTAKHDVLGGGRTGDTAPSSKSVSQVESSDSAPVSDGDESVIASGGSSSSAEVALKPPSEAAKSTCKLLLGFQKSQFESGRRSNRAAWRTCMTWKNAEKIVSQEKRTMPGQSSYQSICINMTDQAKQAKQFADEFDAIQSYWKETCQMLGVSA